MDIEKRLREAHPLSPQCANGSSIFLEAADEIARLRTQELKDSDLIAVVSELVLGYREGKPSEIIQAVARMKSKSMKHEAYENIDELLAVIDRLGELKDEIMERA